jgi:hypothetical protein
MEPMTAYLTEGPLISQVFGQPPKPVGDETPIERMNRIAQQAKVTPEELYARIDGLNKYIASCDTMKPVEWSVVGSPFTSPPDITITAMKIAAYYLMIQHILAYHLPEDKQEYVRCIAALFFVPPDDKDDPCHQDKKCIETIPTDTKESLFAQLDELKAHQCSTVYAYQMNHR